MRKRDTRDKLKSSNNAMSAHRIGPLHKMSKMNKTFKTATVIECWAGLAYMRRNAGASLKLRNFHDRVKMGAIYSFKFIINFKTADKKNA